MAKPRAVESFDFYGKPPKIVKKPWGEEHWLAQTSRLCYKRIYIDEGFKTSYQLHEKKSEVNYIICGQAEVWLEDTRAHVVEKKVCGPGTFFIVEPLQKHRIIALTDLVLQETSTPEVDDVVRIEDDTGRPNGRIESEHNR